MSKFQLVSTTAAVPTNGVYVSGRTHPLLSLVETHTPPQVILVGVEQSQSCLLTEFLSVPIFNCTPWV